MCHLSFSSALLDLGDLDASELLAVALALLVPGLVLELLDDDLGTAEVFEDLSRDLDLCQGSSVRCDLVTINVEDGDELNRASLVSLDAVHRNDGADLYLFLASAGAHYCVNHFWYLISQANRS